MNTFYKLYIFDLDGTLLNTIGDLAAAANFALQKNGLPPRTLAEVQAFVGNGIKNLVTRCVPEGCPEEAVNRVYLDFIDYYKVHYADRTVPYPGIPELLQRLKAAGAMVAVLSNKADFATRLLCEKFFAGSIDFAMGETEGVSRKPTPDGVNRILTRLNAGPQDAVYVGDSEVDVQTAVNAGLPCLSVSWGFRSRDFLLASGARRIADRPEEIG